MIEYNNNNINNSIPTLRRLKRDHDQIVINPTQKMAPNNNNKDMETFSINTPKNNDVNSACINFNKKLKLDGNNTTINKYNDEKYRQNLIKFEKIAEHLENKDNNNSCNLFEVSSKLFLPNGIHSFENMDLYNKVLVNGANLSNGSRLSNISQRIMNKNKFKNNSSSRIMKRDGLRTYYEVALKNKIHNYSIVNNNSTRILNNDIGGKTPTRKQSDTLINNINNNNNNLNGSVNGPFVMKPVSSTASLFQKKFTSSFLTSNSKKSLFNNVNSKTNSKAPSAASSSNTSHDVDKQPTQQKHHDYKKHYYSSDDSDEFDFRRLPKSGSALFTNNNTNSSSNENRNVQKKLLKNQQTTGNFQATVDDDESVFSSDISLSSESDDVDFEDDEGYWDDQFTPGKLHNSGKIKGKDDDYEEEDYDDYDSDGERDKKLDAFYHKKWDNLLKHDNLMNSNRSIRRIDSFEDDSNSVFEERDKTDPLISNNNNNNINSNSNGDSRILMKTDETKNVSNAPLTAHTLLPVAFRTHMFVPNRLQKNMSYGEEENGDIIKESPGDSMSYAGDEDDFKFFSEQQDSGENEPAAKQALKEDNEYKILKQREVMQSLRKQVANKSNNSLFKS